MHRHRFVEQLNQNRMPRPQVAAFNPNAFCACPLCLVMGGSAMQWQQRVYQLAYEEAKAVVKPSILERDLLGVWN